MARAHSRSYIPWLLVVAVVALIVYGSLYPFNFKRNAIEGGVLQALTQLSWARADRGDRISNVLLYLPLGFCLFLSLSQRFRRGSSVLLATLLGTSLSLCIEVAQVYISSRVPSLTDLTLNGAGTVLGASGGLAWGALSRLVHLPARAEQRSRDPGALVLIVLWLAWRFAPFVPQLDLGKLKAALQPLFSPQFDLVAVFIYLTCWLVVNQAIAAVASRQRRLEVLLLLLAAVLVGRLIVASQAFVPAELLALLLLLPMVVLMHRLAPQPRRGLLVLGVAAVLIVDTLAPFDFTSHMGRFDLWPFRAWLETDPLSAVQGTDWVDVFGKLFLFGALMWTVKEWGAPVRLATRAVALLALALEVLQLWLPHQQASIADPLLAAGIGLTMRLLYRRSPPGLGDGPIARRARIR